MKKNRVKKLVLSGVFLTICVFPVSAQVSLMPAIDLYGTAVAWVAENLEDDSEFDGCTWAPDGMFINGRYINWRSACDQHDGDYRNGVDKNEADRRLRDNMIRAGAPRVVAEIYYQFVQRYGQSFYDEAQR
jgi:hypothetical protein